MKKFHIRKEVKPYIYIAVSLCVTILFYKFLNNIGDVVYIIKKGINFTLKILKPLILGLIIAYFLNRPVVCVDKILLRFNFCKRHIRISRGLAILMVYLSLIGIICGIMWYALPQIWISINSIIENTPRYMERFKTFLEGNSIGSIAYQYLNEQGAHIDKLLANYMELDLTVEDIGAYLLDRVMNLGAIIMNLILAIFLSIYLLLDKEVISRQFISSIRLIITKKTYDQWSRNVKYMNDIFYDFIIGKIYCSIIISIIVFLGLILMKVPHASLISLLVAALNIIPYFGPITAGAVGFLITWFNNPIKAIWVLVLMLITQEIEDNLLSPKIIGNAIGLKPFWIMLAVIIGGGIFGIVGMFLAIPAFAILKVFITQWIIRKQGN